MDEECSFALEVRFAEEAWIITMMIRVVTRIVRIDARSRRVSIVTRRARVLARMVKKNHQDGQDSR